MLITDQSSAIAEDGGKSSPQVVAVNDTPVGDDKSTESVVIKNDEHSVVISQMPREVSRELSQDVPGRGRTVVLVW